MLRRILQSSDGTATARGVARVVRWTLAACGLGSAGVAAIATALTGDTSVVAGVFADASPTMLVTQGVGVSLLGLHRLARALVHWANPSYRGATRWQRQNRGSLRTAIREMRRHLRRDLRLAALWILLGGALTATAAWHVSPLAVALAGTVTLPLVLVRATAIALDIVDLQPRLRIRGSRAWLANRPLFRRWIDRSRHADDYRISHRFRELFRRDKPPSQITHQLARTLAALACVWATYAALALGQVAVDVTDVNGGGDGGDVATQRESTGRRTYAEHCPALPDPLLIGHGIGPLFRHDGAVEAGCGARAHVVAADASVWVSEGMCGSELRSLGVASPAGAVLVYGQAASLAKRFADARVLRFAERAMLAGGEIVVLGTSEGSYVFARATLSLRPGRGPAVSCDRVTDVARPFAILPPPLAALWLQRVRRHGWSWPVHFARAAPRTFAFVDPSGATVAHGRCARAYACALWDDAERATSSGSPAVTLAQLAPYAR
jgi:hypothetical protein